MKTNWNERIESMKYLYNIRIEDRTNILLNFFSLREYKEGWKRLFGYILMLLLPISPIAKLKFWNPLLSQISFKY